LWEKFPRRDPRKVEEINIWGGEGKKSGNKTGQIRRGQGRFRSYLAQKNKKKSEAQKKKKVLDAHSPERKGVTKPAKERGEHSAGGVGEAKFGGETTRGKSVEQN